MSAEKDSAFELGKLAEQAIIDSGEEFFFTMKEAEELRLCLNKTTNIDIILEGMEKT